MLDIYHEFTVRSCRFAYLHVPGIALVATSGYAVHARDYRKVKEASDTQPRFVDKKYRPRDSQLPAYLHAIADPTRGRPNRGGDEWETKYRVKLDMRRDARQERVSHENVGKRAAQVEQVDEGRPARGTRSRSRANEPFLPFDPTQPVGPLRPLEATPLSTRILSTGSALQCKSPSTRAPRGALWCIAMLTT